MEKLKVILLFEDPINMELNWQIRILLFL